MTRRRIALLCSGIALFAAAGSGAAHADPDPVRSASEPDYVLCGGLETIDLGSCLENPLPDLSTLPSLRQLLYDLTGIPITG